MIAPPLFRVLLLSISTCLFSSAAFSQSFVPWRSQSNLRGTWREELRVEVSGMTLKTGSAEQSLGGTGAFGFLEIVERDLGRPNTQEAQMLNSSTQGSLAILGNASQDFAKGSELLGKKLIGKKEQNQWKFAFKDVKPSVEEQKALDDFSGRTNMLALWPYFYGSQARRKGETWKADTAAFTKDSKTPPIIDLSFTLVDMADHNGTRCAKIAVNGLIKAAFGANTAGSLQVEVQGDSWRDVRDLVDLEVNLRGTCSLSGFAPKNPNAAEGATSEITAPFTLTQTVKQVKR
jgi:hypothetical protein